MPLSEAEREVRIGREETLSPDSQQRWERWTEAIERLWAQRGRIGRWSVLGLLLSVLLATRICKYEGTTQLMPPDTAPSGLAALALPALSKNPGLSTLGSSGMLGDLMGGKSPGALYAKVLESRTIQDGLVQRFDLRSRYWCRYNEDARKELGKRTRIEEDKKSGVIAITVRDRDPEVAAAMAAAYVEELDRVLTTVSTSSARRERIFIEQRLVEERKALGDSERQYAQFESTSMALDVPEQTRVMLGAAARLQGELIAAQSELAGLEQIYAPENIRVKSLRARVGELQSQLRKINGEPGPGAGKPDPTNPYPGVKNLPGLGVQWADLYRNTKIHETVFEMLTQEYELARIQEAKEIPRVKVLDAAAVPEKRSPRPWFVVLLGTLLGVVLACTGAMVEDKWNTWNPDDPRKILLSHMLSRVRRS